MDNLKYEKMLGYFHCLYRGSILILLLYKVNYFYIAIFYYCLVKIRSRKSILSFGISETYSVINFCIITNAINRLKSLEICSNRNSPCEVSDSWCFG